MEGGPSRRSLPPDSGEVERVEFPPAQTLRDNLLEFRNRKSIAIPPWVQSKGTKLLPTAHTSFYSTTPYQPPKGRRVQHAQQTSLSTPTTSPPGQAQTQTNKLLQPLRNHHPSSHDTTSSLRISVQRQVTRAIAPLLLRKRSLFKNPTAVKSIAMPPPARAPRLLNQRERGHGICDASKVSANQSASYRSKVSPIPTNVFLGKR